MTDDLGLLTTKEAAELLRLSPTAVRNLRLSNSLITSSLYTQLKETSNG